MINEQTFKGVIFDMDNTLLKSNIDFENMKKTVYDFLVGEGMINQNSTWKNKTASQIIEEGRLHPEFYLIESEVWKLVEEVEAKGMEGAQLEANAMEMIHHLKDDGKIITVLTNNAFTAAEKVLVQFSMFHLFDLVLGREHMKALKPSPSGVYFIMDHWKNIKKEEWVLVGDSWIDGKAAEEAGIHFIAYQSELSQFLAKGITPLKHILDLIQLKRLI